MKKNIFYIELFMNENYNKDKYIIALNVKYDIMEEEINFLKEKNYKKKLNI